MCDNLTVLKQKLNIVLAINAATLAFDMGLSYYTNSLTLKLEDREKNVTFRKDLSETIGYKVITTIKPACYGLGTMADSNFLSGMDKDLNIITNEDVKSYDSNLHYLGLHLAKTGVRIAEYFIWKNEYDKIKDSC
jgi:hypothetical protein